MTENYIPIKNRLVTALAESWLSSCRLRIKMNFCTRTAIRQNQPLIIALWHQSLIYTVYHFHSYPAVVMVSGNRDASWVAESLRRWGQTPVRGSRHKGGLMAVREMGRLMKLNNLNAGIVADGSQGPARKVQIGALILARDTGYPVIPTGFAAASFVRFNSWDRMILPMPLSKVFMVYGEPIKVPLDCKGKKLESVRLKLENGLDKATLMAESLVVKS